MNNNLFLLKRSIFMEKTSNLNLGIIITEQLVWDFPVKASHSVYKHV